MSSITHAIRSDFITNTNSMGGDTTSPIYRDFSLHCDREQASPISAIMNYTPPTPPRCQSPVATRKPTSAGDSEHSEAEADAVSALQMMMLLRTPPKEKTDLQFFPTDGDHSDCESHSGSECEYDTDDEEDECEDPQIVERRLSTTLRKRLYGSSTAPSDDEDEDEAYNVPKRRIAYAHAYPDTTPDIASWRDRLRRQQPSVTVSVPRPVPIRIVPGMNARVEKERAVAVSTPVVTKKQGPMSYPMTPAPSHEAEPVVSSSRMRRTSSSSSTTSPTTPHHTHTHHRSSITSTSTSNRTCAACRASQTPCWRPGFTPGTWLCNSCGLRYKKTGVRCVNEECCYLPVRTEWREMKLGSAGGKGGMRCLQCGGEVKVRGG
ncbi:hypothetical protein YB2330_002877 [Saitoella coloradoensis]